MTESPPRVLHFHTGTWKTGSTALQAFLDRNRGRLSDAGVSYEFQPRTDHAAGNGRHLWECLFGHHVASDKLCGLLEDYFAGRATAVCSSEDFTGFGNREWQQLFDACARLRIYPRTITYVRDVVPYYQSLHGQLYKTGGHWCSFDEYSSTDCYRPVVNSLTCLLELVGRDAMTVVHYDSTIDQVDIPFIAALGIPTDGFDRTMLADRLNRSLTQYEIDILREVIQKTGVQLAPALATLLLNTRPALKATWAPAIEVVEKLRSRHCVDVDWLNSVFFDGVNIVNMIPEMQPTDMRNELSASDKQAIDKDVASWCLSALESSQDAAAGFIAERLAHIDWRNIGHPALPSDFDPIAYLLLNLDILKSGARPCEHYISHGRTGHGRRWRW